MAEKKPIAPTLRQMQVGDECVFPVERLVTVRVTVGRMHQQFKRRGTRYTIATRGFNVYVTRIA